MSSVQPSAYSLPPTPVVTGAAGFIGRRVVARLAAGAEVIARARAAAPKVRIERMRSPEMIEASPDECSGWRGFAVINGP